MIFQPLHLAASVSTPEIVGCLVDHGARLVARLFNGTTALHIAAARGSVPMIEILMAKSIANEEEENDRVDLKKRVVTLASDSDTVNDTDHVDDFDDSETIGSQDSFTDDSLTQGFIKLRTDEADISADKNGVDDENLEDPDVYDVDVLAWDQKTSPLHLAIMNGHIEAVQCLVEDFAANPLLPVVLTNGWNNASTGVLLTMVLGMSLPKEQAKKIVKLLLDCGVTSSLADTKHFTALQRVILKEEKNSKGKYSSSLFIYCVFYLPSTGALLESINHISFFCVH